MTADRIATRHWSLVRSLLWLALGICIGVLAGRASAATNARSVGVEGNTRPGTYGLGDEGRRAEPSHPPGGPRQAIRNRPAPSRSIRERSTILAFADVQQQPNVFAKLLDHTWHQADYLLGVGDYVQDGCPQRCDQWWPFVATFAGRDFSRLRDIALARGNHDGGYWQMFGWPMFGGSWYVKNWGTLCLVVIDSGEEVPIRYSLLGGGVQREWLARAVASDAWHSARWRAVAFHHPHRTELWDGGCYYPRRQELEEIVTMLMAAGVDLVLNGHAHGYQRGRLPNGGLLVITGGGGGYLDRWCRDEVEIDVALAVHHVCLIDASDTALVVRAIGVDGREIDRAAR